MMNSEIRKVLIIGLIIGIGHILSVLMIPIATRWLPTGDISLIVLLDSSLMMTISLLSFGVAIKATRDIALSESWLNKVEEVKDARLTFSCILSVVGIIAFAYSSIELLKVLPLIIAPVLALNLDFALYGKGEPLKAAFSSFMRLSFPLISFYILLLLVPDTGASAYAVLMILGGLAAGYYVSTCLGSSYFGRFRLESLNLYKIAIPVGVAGVMINFHRIGFVSAYSEVFSDEERVILYGVLKVYFAFIAVRRLFIQTFYTKLKKDSLSLKLDALLLIVGLSTFTLCLLIPEQLSILLYQADDRNYLLAIKMIGAVVFAGSFFATSDARLMLFNGDRFYVATSILASVIFVVLSCLMFVSTNNLIIVLFALLVSELVLSLGYKISCYKAVKASRL